MFAPVLAEWTTTLTRMTTITSTCVTRMGDDTVADDDADDFVTTTVAAVGLVSV